MEEKSLKSVTLWLFRYCWLKELLKEGNLSLMPDDFILPETTTSLIVTVFIVSWAKETIALRQAIKAIIFLINTFTVSIYFWDCKSNTIFLTLTGWKLKYSIISIGVELCNSKRETEFFRHRLKKTTFWYLEVKTLFLELCFQREKTQLHLQTDKYLSTKSSLLSTEKRCFFINTLFWSKKSWCLGSKELMFILKRVGFNFLKPTLFLRLVIDCLSNHSISIYFIRKRNGLLQKFYNNPLVWDSVCLTIIYLLGILLLH